MGKKVSHGVSPMMISLHTSYRIHLVGYALPTVISLLWIVGCATNKATLMQEIEVLLQQTREEVRQETNRMDMEIARLRSDVGELHSAVGQVDSKVGRLGSAVGQVGSEVTRLRTDMRKNDSSIVDLAMRVNQLDQRAVKSDMPSPSNSDMPSPSNDERASQRAEVRSSPISPQQVADAVSSPSAEPSNALKQGMSQQEILRLFGNPHSMEKILDSVYWYYADGELKGQYVRFDATTGYVNGWSSFSPQPFQIDLRATPRRPMR
jgi:hypothetical protein